MRTSYFTIKYLERGGTICDVHGINSKTCKRSKKCYTRSATTPINLNKGIDKTVSTVDS